MGLAGVELILEFEDVLGIKLDDREVTAMRTPRDVIEVIVSKLKTTDERICQTQRAFHIVRRALLDMFSLDRKAVTVDMPFRGLIPRRCDKETWERIREAVAARSWPQLVRPGWMSPSILAGCLAITGGGVLAAVRLSTSRNDPIVGAVVFAWLFAILLFVITALRLTRSFRVHIPSCFKSIRDLIPYVVTSDHIKWTREQVAILVRQVVMDQLGIKASEYTEDSRFIEDFHVD
jgi:acyl carrier protein